jgi:hypothetical protein
MKLFTAKKRSSRRSEYFLIKNSFLCVLGVSRGESSECFVIFVRFVVGIIDGE